MEAQGALPSTAQEQASFLAGLPLPKQSPLYHLQESSEYRQHQKELQEQWTFCRRIRYDTMQQWGRDHLARYAVTRGVLRYLFGGPDFLNAYAFFPDTRVISVAIINANPTHDFLHKYTVIKNTRGPGTASVLNAKFTQLSTPRVRLNTQITPRRFIRWGRRGLPRPVVRVALTVVESKLSLPSPSTAAPLPGSATSGTACTRRGAQITNAADLTA